MKVHELKIEYTYYSDIQLGHKTFEIRKNDRGFGVGDLLILNAYDEAESIYITVCEPLVCRVIYMTDYEQKDDYVVMGIKVMK
jgi:hypothetical protein